MGQADHLPSCCRSRHAKLLLLRRVTAWREAHEEMDPVPELTELGHVLAMRGKHLQKHYTVFVCRMEPQLVRVCGHVCTCVSLRHAH